MRRVVYLAVLAVTLAPAATASAETAADEHVAQQIGSHIKQSGQLQNYRVGVKYHDGVAYLTGSVVNAEQRDAAVRLAQQVEGVSHVVCKLECPNKRSKNADGADRSQANAGDGRHELAEALDRASYSARENESTGVMQAYQQMGDAEAAPSQQNPMMRRQQMPMMQRQPMPMRQGQNARMPAPQMRRGNMPVPSQRMPGMMPIRQASATGVSQASAACAGGNGGGMGTGMGAPYMGGPDMGQAPNGFVPGGAGHGANSDNPQMPGYAWPSYASYPNYAALSYPQQYSPTAWPYIGPFYPYPQVPLAWRKVSLEWDDGWWFLDFSSHNSSH